MRKLRLSKKNVRRIRIAIRISRDVPSIYRDEAAEAMGVYDLYAEIVRRDHEKKTLAAYLRRYPERD